MCVFFLRRGDFLFCFLVFVSLGVPFSVLFFWVRTERRRGEGVREGWLCFGLSFFFFVFLPFFFFVFFCNFGIVWHVFAFSALVFVVSRIFGDFLGGRIIFWHFCHFLFFLIFVSQKYLSFSELILLTDFLVIVLIGLLMLII